MLNTNMSIRVCKDFLQFRDSKSGFGVRKSEIITLTIPSRIDFRYAKLVQHLKII